jgi:hypothetical protein
MLERRRSALKSGSAYAGLFAAASRFESAYDRIPEVDLRRAVSPRVAQASPPQRVGLPMAACRVGIRLRKRLASALPASPLAPRLPPTVASDR